MSVIQYGNLSLHRVVEITYDPVAHTVSKGVILDSPPSIPSGLGAGAELDRQTVGSDVYSLRVQDTAPYAYYFHYTTGSGGPPLPQDLVINSVDIVAAIGSGNGSITVHAHGTGTFRYSIGAVPQVSNVFNVAAGFYYITLSRTEDDYSVTTTRTVPQINNLVVQETDKGSSAIGANDGAIFITIYNGSGHYTIAYADGFTIDLDGPVATGHTRSPLAPDIYSGTVTDRTTGQVVNFFTTLKDPPPVVQPPPPPQEFGSIFGFPFLNSIRFVSTDAIDVCNNVQGLDNVLFSKMKWRGFKKVPYYILRNQCDKTVVQFNSDFKYNQLSLFKCGDDPTIAAPVKSLDVVLKQANIGKTLAFNVSIQNHIGFAGKSRIYFTTAVLPIPIAVNTNFQIDGTADYDGNYLVLDIKVDDIVGKQYLVINKNFVGPTPSVDGTATFAADEADFNVYESSVDLSDVDEGFYFIYAKAFSTNQKTFTSEPISVKENHEDTYLFVATHHKDGHGGITWSTGYQASIRVPGWWAHIGKMGGLQTTNRNADDSLNQVSSHPARIVPIYIYKQPLYIHERLALLLQCKNKSLNNVEIAAPELYPNPQWVEGFPLADVTVEVEQKYWFGPLTNTGIGTVVDGGFIKTESGFLKR